jgi:hypothetical protein
MVVHICNLSTQKAEAKGWQIQGQPGQHSETPTLKKEKKRKRNTIVTLNVLYF